MYIFNYFSLIEKIIGRAKGMSLAIISPLGLDINTSLILNLLHLLSTFRGLLSVFYITFYIKDKFSIGLKKSPFQDLS